MQLAPLPTMATLLPPRSPSEGHLAVCQVSPLQVSRPSMLGRIGGLKMPAALMTTLASMISVRPSTTWL